MISYVVKRYVLDEKELEVFIDLVSSVRQFYKQILNLLVISIYCFIFKLVSSSITYPLSLVSTVSCVAGSGIVAGQPPRMRIYNSWIDIFQHLYETVSSAWNHFVSKGLKFPHSS